ncbi:MAG: nicotinate-nucleotide adenylyltransferase [Gemmatimonadota bacterium]|nr:nicotinate-nucleotide adenylyltransferase [Gemmatimonadota bacterium]
MSQGPDDRPDPSRLGVFGGTFDPPHVGHLAVAADVAASAGLDRVLWIPAGAPPHKEGADVAPAAVRVEMVRAAVSGDPLFAVSDVEVARPGPSYTVDTLRRLGELYPGSELFLLIGGDQFRHLDTWRAPGEIFRLATVLVMDREGEVAAGAPPPLADAASALFVPVTRVDVSSTEIRRRVREGRSIRYLVPGGVEEIIRRESLYVEPGDR